MSDDLSDWTEPPGLVQDGVMTSALTLLGLVPVVGNAAASTVQGFVAHKVERWTREGFSRVASRLRALEERGLIATDQLLQSDEFVAAFASVQQQLGQTASEEKRERLANALSRMGSWGPGDAYTRSAFLALVEQYDDIHVLLLDFLSDPVTWIRRGTPGYEPPPTMTSNLNAALDAYVFPGQPDWRFFVEPVVSQLGRDGLINTGGGLVTDLVDTNVMPVTTPRGERFLRFIADGDIRAGSWNPVDLGDDPL